MSFGAARLQAELLNIGLQGREPQPGFVVIDWRVPVGPLTDETLEIGWNVPADYPATIPSGLLVRPHLLPMMGAGEPPLGGIHLSEVGGVQDHSFQYWSRPHVDWGQSSKDAAALLSHARRLFNALPHDLSLPGSSRSEVPHAA